MMWKRWLKSLVALGYLSHLLFTVFLWFGENIENPVSARFDVESEMVSMLNDLANTVQDWGISEENIVPMLSGDLKNTGETLQELSSGDFVNTAVVSASGSRNMSEESSYAMGNDSIDIHDELDAMYLDLWKKHAVAVDTWIGDIISKGLDPADSKIRDYPFMSKGSRVLDGDMDLSLSNGKILKKTILEYIPQPYSSVSWELRWYHSQSHGIWGQSQWNFLDTHIFVVLPEGAEVISENGRPYTQRILAPKIEDKEFFVDGDKYNLVFSVGWARHLQFRYADGSPAYADFYVSVDNSISNKKFPVYFSQDGSWWNYLDTANIVDFVWNNFLTFQADHFTYFAVGTQEWSFLINNGDISTATTGVVLYNNVQNITQMKFGNSTWEVLSASFEPFSSTKNWYLTTGDGTKRVYAIFDDGLWNTGMTSDTIILDTDATLSGVVMETLPVLDGLTLWFDADDTSTLMAWAGDLVSQRDDKSDYRYDALQNTSSASPTLQSNRIRTKSALHFDGSSDYLALSGLHYNWTTAISWLFVCSVFRTSFSDNNRSSNRAFLDFDRSDFFNFYIHGNWKVSFSFRAGSTTDNYGSNTYNDDIPHIACASYDSSLVNDTKIIVDGNIELEADNVSSGQYIGKSSTRFGFIGDGSEANSFDGTRNNKYYDWDIAEIVYYDTAVSSWDQKKIQCYLSDKRWINVDLDCSNNLSWMFVLYSPDASTITSGGVLATLTWYDPSMIEILNNSGSNQYFFDDNGSSIFLYSDAAGNIWSTVATVTWIDKVKPTASVYYNPSMSTTWSVLAILTGFSETWVVITNNGGSSGYVFTEDGSFVFEYRDSAWNTGNTTAMVTWIENTGWVAYVVYSPDGSMITSWDVLANLIWNEPITITNNGGSSGYVFTGNWSFIFEYTYSWWTLTWSKTAYVNWIDAICSTGNVVYDPVWDTYGSVVATLWNFAESSVLITNNSGSNQYVFDDNGDFVFELMDAYWNTGETVAHVDRIKSTTPDDLIVARKISGVWPMVWKSVSFEKNYTTAPLVFVTPVTENTVDTYPIPLVRNVTSNGFEITSCVEQWNGVCSTTANVEDFHYFVVDPSDISWLPWIDVGTISATTDWSDTPVTFNKTFAHTPYVWTTPQTYSQWWNNGMVAWVDDDTLSTTAMDIVWCTHDGAWNNCIAGTNESVAYMAIDVQNANITGFQYGTKSISDSTWTVANFGSSYIEPRIMITQNSDNGWQDPQYPWAKNITDTSAEIRYCEQDAAWVCDTHTAEDVMWFTLEWDVPPTAHVVYNITWITTQDVIATLTWESENITIINNNWDRDHIFSGNWVFVYQFKDSSNNINTVTAEVTWIDKSLPFAEITYANELYEEDKINNDGTIETWIVLNLSWDEFVSNVSWYVGFENMPDWLTGLVNYISGTQVTIDLTWTATSHLNSDDVDNFTIIFYTWAFIINAPSRVQNSTKNDILIDFYDPFATWWFYPVADTLLDADTDAANYCDNGSCQEANYGALSYMWASEFWSVSLIKFDLSSIPTWSVIVSASLDLTRMDIWVQWTWFDLTKIVNNPWWIEWVGNGAWQTAVKALVGEPNFKQRKWTQENWNNGDPGLATGSDYVDINLLDNSYFDTLWTETKKFYFNTIGVDTLQEWLDLPESNQWFAFGHADKDWTIIYTKEKDVVWYRPQLFVNYIPDIVNPQISSLSPLDNQTGVALDSQLSLVFDERIHAVSWYYIWIKRSEDDSVFESLDVWSGQVSVDDDTVMISLSSDLENNTGYYIQIDSGAFVDRANNPFTGILDTTTWNFTTLDTSSVPLLTGENATWITQTTGVLWAEIISTWSSVITERWIYWDLIDGFNPIVWNKVSEMGSWNSVGSFSVPVTGLPSGLRVYYRAFASNNAGIGFSSQSMFLTKPANPVALTAGSISNRSAVAHWWLVTWADSYELYVATDSGFANLLSNYSPKIWLVSSSYAIDNLSPETPYFYKVVAKNSAWYSLDSNTISFTTTYLPFPIMHLALEETWGAIAMDSSSNHDGILAGAVVFGQTGVDNKAYCFNGVDAKISTVDFSYGPDFVVQFRFRDTENTAQEYLFSHGGNTDSNSVNVFLDDSDSTLKTQVNGQTLFVISWQKYNDLLDGNWHMYTLVVDDNFAAWGYKKIALYLDGDPWAIDTSLTAGSYNPVNNITMGRRSVNSASTYYSWCLDDIRIYNQDLFDYEVKDLYDAFVTDVQAPYVPSTSPTSGEVDVDIQQILEVDFSKAMNHASVEATGVVTLSPTVGGVSYTWNGDVLEIHHDPFLFSTGYVATISTGAQDLSWVAMENPYSFNFTTQNNIFLSYTPTIFEESVANDWSIKNTLTIDLTGDTFSSGVVSSWYISLQNVPLGLTWSFVRVSDTQILFILTWNAVNHNDVNDVDTLTISFADEAFVNSLATDVSSSTKNDLYIDFNDPNSMSFYPIRDTSLDITQKDYNYGASTYHVIGDGSFVLIDFDLTTLPAGATINSATLTLTKLDGSWNNFVIGSLINNSWWVEWTKLWSLATNGESTYNQLGYNQISWFGASPGLISWTDYNTNPLVDTVIFSWNETRIFSLNAEWIARLSGWIANPDTNEGFVLYGGNGRFSLGSKDNSLESFRPKLLISYSLPAEPPASMSIGIDSWVLFAQEIIVDGQDQEVSQQLSGYLRVDDPVGADSGWYTTLSITDLTWTVANIPNDNIFLQASGVVLLSWTANTGVIIASWLTNYQVFSGVLTYIERPSWFNGGVTGRYGNKAWLKILVPAYQKIEEYHAMMTYTLYEN